MAVPLRCAMRFESKSSVGGVQLAFHGARIAAAAIVLLPLFPIYGTAADSALNRPILGYAARVLPPQLRAIVGVPGAAVFSDPLSLPNGTTRLHVAPGQQYAIIERAEEVPGALFLNGMETGGIVAIPAVVAAPDFVSFSPSGRSALLISLALGRLQVITGLPRTPQIVENIDVHLMPDVPSNAAISDDASSVLSSSAAAVYLILCDGSTAIILSVARSASIPFLRASTAAMIGDPGTGSLYPFQCPAGGVVAQLLASGLTGLGQMAASGEGQTLYVTDTEGQRIWNVNVGSGAAGQTALQVNVPELKGWASYLGEPVIWDEDWRIA